MPKSYWTRIQTPNGLKYFRADDVTDELMQKIKDAANAFYATYIYNGPDSGNTSYEGIKAAYDAGRSIYVKYKENVSDVGTELFALVSFTDYTGTPTPTTFNHFRFQTLEQSTGKTIYRFPGNWGKMDDHTFADSANLWSLKNAIAKDFALLDFPVAEGTYCTYGYDLYRANQEVSTDTWIESQWTKVNVMDELGKGGVAYVEILQTPFADVLSLYNQGKLIVGRSGYEFYNMIGYGTTYDDITSFRFQSISGPVVMTWTVADGGPSETNNWVTPPSIYFNASIYSIAAPYDETSTYGVGDVVSHNYDLYRCTTDISVAEPWTDAHWTQTTVAEELKFKDWATSITAFRTGDVIPVDGPSGTAKMAKDDLLKETAQNALAGNVAQAFDDTRTASNPYQKGEYVSYKGITYQFKNTHYGAWSSSDVTQVIPIKRKYDIFCRGQIIFDDTTIKPTQDIIINYGKGTFTIPANVSYPITYTSGYGMHAIYADVSDLTLKAIRYNDNLDLPIIAIVRNSSTALEFVVSCIFDYSVDGVFERGTYSDISAFSDGYLIAENDNNRFRFSSTCRIVFGPYYDQKSYLIGGGTTISYSGFSLPNRNYVLVYNPNDNSFSIKPYDFIRPRMYIVARFVIDDNNKVLAFTWSCIRFMVTPSTQIPSVVSLTAVFNRGYIDLSIQNHTIKVYKDLIIQYDGRWKNIPDGSSFSWTNTGSSLNAIHFRISTSELYVAAYSSINSDPIIATFSTTLGITSSSLPIRLEGIDCSIISKGSYFGEKIKLDRRYNTEAAFSITGLPTCQCMQVYGNYLISAIGDNIGNATIYVSDLTTKVVLATLSVSDNSEIHCNTMSIGITKLNADSITPPIYLSKWNYNGDRACLVYDIQEQNGTYSISLVQKIVNNAPSVIAGEGSLDWVVDTDRAKLYSIAYRLAGGSSIVEGNANMVCEFDLPDTSSSSVTLVDEDVVDHFELPIINITQDKVYHCGKIYIIAGIGSSNPPTNKLAVVDLTKKMVTSVVPLGSISEPEGLAYYNGDLIFDNGGATKTKFIFD